MIGGKINLATLDHVLMNKKDQNGKDIECIVIPVKKNNLFVSEKGNVYLDIIAFELKEPKHGDTHLVKQSLPKKIREAMSEEELKKTPIMGNLKVMGLQEADPSNAAGDGVVLNENDNLPFD